MSTNAEPILIAGEWRVTPSSDTFHAENPALGKPTEPAYPVSSREEVLEMVHAGAAAAEALWHTPPAKIANFLRIFADAIEEHREKLVAIAHEETAYPKEPRLNSVELPRTVGQLRLAAEAAETQSWTRPIIDAQANIRSMFGPLGGSVVVMGPNNFPFAFNSVSGGDFAAAIAARNPVIAKANKLHPGTTQRLAELAHQAVLKSGLHPATIQVFYHCSNEVGFDLVSHLLVGATAFTGSKIAGLKLKAAADRAGKPIYLEMSSINPVILLPGALREKAETLAEEFASSCMLGAGQFCTNPGLVLLQRSAETDRFLARVKEKFEATAPGILLSGTGLGHLLSAVKILTGHGARLVTGGKSVEGPAYRSENTLLTVDGATFLESPAELQTEAFGPVSLVVVVDDLPQLLRVLQTLEGNLTGSIYSAMDGSEEKAYSEIEPVLRRKVGRLLNDKMPTGVAVSPAMNHGGPYPATGHPGFTAVGLPVGIQRFAALYCYDNCRPGRLPSELKSA